MHKIVEQVLVDREIEIEKAKENLLLIKQEALAGNMNPLATLLANRFFDLYVKDLFPSTACHDCPLYSDCGGTKDKSCKDFIKGWLRKNCND